MADFKVSEMDPRGLDSLMRQPLKDRNKGLLEQLLGEKIDDPEVHATDGETDGEEISQYDTGHILYETDKELDDETIEKAFAVRNTLPEKDQVMIKKREAGEVLKRRRTAALNMSDVDMDEDRRKALDVDDALDANIGAKEEENPYPEHTFKMPDQDVYLYDQAHVGLPCRCPDAAFRMLGVFPDKTADDKLYVEQRVKEMHASYGDAPKPMTMRGAMHHYRIIPRSMERMKEGPLLMAKMKAIMDAHVEQWHREKAVEDDRKNRARAKSRITMAHQNREAPEPEDVKLIENTPLVQPLAPIKRNKRCNSAAVKNAAMARMQKADKEATSTYLLDSRFVNKMQGFMVAVVIPDKTRPVRRGRELGEPLIKPLAVFADEAEAQAYMHHTAAPNLDPWESPDIIANFDFIFPQEPPKDVKGVYENKLHGEMSKQADRSKRNAEAFKRFQKKKNRGIPVTTLNKATGEITQSDDADANVAADAAADAAVDAAADDADDDETLIVSEKNHGPQGHGRKKVKDEKRLRQQDRKNRRKNKAASHD